jgi:hypothetical protein
MTLQVRRGLSSNRTTVTPAEGELLYDTDTKLVYVGDGTTAGGVPMSSSGGGGDVGLKVNMSYGIGDGVMTVIDSTAAGNNAFGHNALANVTLGQTNNAFGLGVLGSQTTGGDNTAMGDNTLHNLVTGDCNTAIGASSMFYTTSGNQNTALGEWSLEGLASGSNNTALGAGSMQNAAASNNVAVGLSSSQKTHVNNQTSVGYQALKENYYGQHNVAVGSNSQINTGKETTADKIFKGASYGILDPQDTDFTTVGAANSNAGTTFTATGPGTGAGIVVPIASERNVSVGSLALTNNLTGRRSVAVGHNALGASKYGVFNTGVGNSALELSITASNNVAMGRAALSYIGAPVAATTTIAGKIYTILTTGDTDFTAIGAADSSFGTVFTATGAGSGTGTVSVNADHNVAIGSGASGFTQAVVETGALKTGSYNTFIGSYTLPLTPNDDNCIVIGSQAVGMGSNTAVIGNTTTTSTHLRGEVFHNNSIIMPKESGKGIMVDPSAPTYCWQDLLGPIVIRGTGIATDPTFNVFHNSIRAYQFTVNDYVELMFHLPHDYVAGSDVYMHVHWGHNNAGVTSGDVTWEFETMYAKGHNQAAFPTSKIVTVTETASTVQYQHMIAETAISSAGGSTTLIDNAAFEPDGIFMIRVRLTANTMNGGPEPFLFLADMHYQSTGIGTKQKAPNFYS